MINLLSYLMSCGLVTEKSLPAELDAAALGMPKIGPSPCQGAECSVCQQECPTDAIKVSSEGSTTIVEIDRGACINCAVCIDICPSGTIVPDRDPVTAAKNRQDLILTNIAKDAAARAENKGVNPFSKSVHARVVSTGCSACDLEISAAGNPIFDMERFGVHVVASPRYADVLMVTGPVPKAMHDALKRCYDAMAEPRRVIAVGSCACSGGVHKGGYTEANGAAAVIPVDVFIPGCPPHPWSIIAGVLLAMDRLPLERLKHGGN